MRISHKLILGFSIVVLLTLLVTTLNYLGAKDIGKSLADTKYGPILSEITDMSGFIKRYQSTLLTYMLTGEPIEKEKTEKRIHDWTESHEKLDALTTLSEEKILQTQVHDEFAQVTHEGSTLINLYDNGATGGEIAAQAKVFKTSVGVGRRSIDAFRDVQLTKLENARKGTVNSVKKSIKLGFILGGITFVLAIGLGLFIYRSISTPIAKLKDAAGQIAEGNLDARVEATAKDEIGVLARSFNQMADEVKKSRDASEGQQQALVRSNAELEQFAYVATHDLQEPLRMVISYTQLLERRYKDKLDKDANEFIEFAVDGANRMKGLINDLLEYSRIGPQGKEFKPTDCDLVLSGALANLRTAIEDSSAAVTQDPLPTVMADGSQLGQVFQNIIGNALKYRSEGPPRVHVSAEQNDGYWSFSVRDNGIGIDPQYAERIFTMFQRLHSREEYSGTGIGLAVSKKIVERHGGQIWVESAVGKGSTFYFNIPVKGSEEL